MEEAKINQGEENPGCDSCRLPWVVWKCTKGARNRKKEARTKQEAVI